MISSSSHLPILSAVVVEDSLTQGVAIRQRVQRCGFTVRLASGGQAAIEEVTKSTPTVVLTDLDMPGMDGLELIRTLNRDFPGLPVLLLTAKGSEEIAVQALQAGAAGYVPKHRVDHDLPRVLESILAILRANKAHHPLGQSLVESESKYRLPNDVSLIPPLVSRLQKNLERQHRFSQSVLLRLGMALREALVNAIEHGNLELTSELRESDDDAYRKLLSERRNQEPYRNRCVYIRARESRHSVEYRIADDGPGFDPATLPDPTDPENLEKTSGRGLLLIQSFMDEVAHNAAGNEITLIKYV